MTTPDAAPPPGEVPPAAEAQSNPAAAPSDATPAPDTAADTGPAAAAAPAATDTPAGEGGASSAARDMSLSALDISIPSVSSIGKKKGPTPPPTPPPEVEKEPAKHPPGVFSVYLTQDTALSVGVDRDDAKHESLQLVPARKVFEDIKTRGPASEFYPLKGQLQNYWEPNFTFRFINDDRYLNNDNFEIYATYDAREKLLAVRLKPSTKSKENATAVVKISFLNELPRSFPSEFGVLIAYFLGEGYCSGYCNKGGARRTKGVEKSWQRRGS